MPRRAIGRRRRLGTRYARRGVRRAARRISKRGYVRKRVSSSKMFRKRVLNIASVKKADHMLAVRKQDVLTPVDPLTGVGPTIVNPNAGLRQVYGWIATARTNENLPGVPAGPIDDSSRTKDTCFMRGLKEKIGIETQSALPFIWRRICFTFVGQEILRDQTSANIGTMYQEMAPTGWTRTMTHLFGGGVSGAASYSWSQLEVILFRGVRNTDWGDYITAPIDKSRVRVKYDRTRRMVSTNNQGQFKKLSIWHPMNRNLVYNDDESAGGRITSALSANHTGSLGDYYVIDVFGFSTNATTDDAISFDPEATLYWHER